MNAKEVLTELGKIYPSKFLRAVIKGEIIQDIGDSAVIIVGKKFKYFGSLPSGFTRCGVSIVCANDELVEMLNKAGIKINVVYYDGKK